VHTYGQQNLLKKKGKKVQELEDGSKIHKILYKVTKFIKKKKKKNGKVQELED